MILKSFVICALLAAPATAQTFDGAIQAWLAGEDTAALMAFGELARGGDTKAQLLLGQIASQSHYWPAEIAALPRKERNALLRAPGGLSGKSWTALAAETDPLAQAFEGSTRVGEKAEALTTLLERNEINAVEKAFPGFVASGEWEAAYRLATHPAAAPAMRLAAPGLEDIRRNGTAATTPIMTRLRRSDVRWPEAVENPDLLAFEGARIAQMADLSPFVSFCESACDGDGVAQCVGAIAVTSSGDPALLVSSPVETHLSTETYRQSPRAVRDVAGAIDVTQVRLDQSADPALA